MKKNAKRIFVGLLIMGLLSTVSIAKNYELTCPDGTIKVDIAVGDAVTYSVSYRNRTILAASPVSLTVDQTVLPGRHPTVSHSNMHSTTEILRPAVQVKSKTIENQYNELTLTFQEPVSLVFRAYDDGIAYRFCTRLDGAVKVTGEQIEYNFPEDYPIYFPQEDSFYTHQERAYLYSPLSKLEKKRFSSIPALVEVPRGPRVLLTESDLMDYPGFYLQAQGNTTLKGIFPHYPKTEKDQSDRDRKVMETENFIAQTDGKRCFPWRAMVIAETDADLILSELVYKLASPCEIEDTSWIRPGKVAWDWWNAFNTYGVDFRSGVNTDNYKYYIDFASKYGIEYVILDEGWYPLGNLLETVDELDMETLLAYSKEKNVRLILWTTWKTLDEQFDAAMDQFEKWGVAGLKVDFMQRDDQKMVQYYEKVSAECAKRKMLVDFHGSYKPAGIRRRYPNVLTREGVFGNEQGKWSKLITPEHRLTLPFIRMVAGPMDFTPGAMRNFQPEEYTPIFTRPGSMGTRCHEMSMFVLFESPLQMLCDNPSQYWREPDCMEFLGPVPPVWDETKVLDAKITQYLYMARKSGQDWYLGGMTNKKRSYELDLSFLDANATYQMTLFRDGINADRYAEDYKKVTSTVKAGDHVVIEMAPAGGFAARLIKQ